MYPVNILNSHYLQSEQWAIARHGSVWTDETLVWHEEPLRTFVRRTPLGVLVFVPGLCPTPASVNDITEFLLQKYPEAFVIKLETVSSEDAELQMSLIRNGWRKGRTTQYSHTVQLDLSKNTDQLLKDMKKRARNEINRAKNNNVRVVQLEPSDEELTKMYDLLTNTANRKQFTVHDKNFLFTYWRAMRDANMLWLFKAELNSQTLAQAVILVSKDGSRAWYKEGASTLLEPQLNAPRLLLWEIAQKLQQDGVKSFDLGGIPDPATYELSRMKGIYIFKTAYTNEITKMMPVYELPLKPIKYKLWPKTELALKKLAFKKGENWY